FDRLLAQTEALSLISQLIPWFVWCMLPLALANVLLNNLMARRQFRVVPYLLIVAIAYVVTLIMAGTTFVRVIQILGVYTSAFFFVTAGFTWGGRIKEVVVTSDKKQDLPDQSLS